MAMPSRTVITEVKEVNLPADLPASLFEQMNAASETATNDVIQDVEVLPAVVAGNNPGDIAHRNPAEHLKAYAFQQGVSPNPSGRPRADPEIRKLVKEKSLTAFKTLVELMENPKTPAKTRCDAAQAILDRAYGKAVQPIDAQIDGGGGAIVIAFTGQLKEWAG
jgi:hypothetical protein